MLLFARHTTRIATGLFAILFTQFSFSQQQTFTPTHDTSMHMEYLSEISLVGSGQQRDVMMLPEVVGTKINAGKKSMGERTAPRINVETTPITVNGGARYL